MKSRPIKEFPFSTIVTKWEPSYFFNLVVLHMLPDDSYNLHKLNLKGERK